MRKITSLFLIFVFSMAFTGERSVYAQSNLSSQLSALQVQEATLLSENKSLKKQIELVQAEIKKKKKTIVAGAVVGGLTAATGVGGLIYAKGQKNKEKILQNEINAIADRDTLIQDILKLSTDLCKTDNLSPCSLVFGDRNLAQTEEDLNLKSDTELMLLKAELSRYDEYEKMIHFIVQEEMCSCFKNGTCDETDDGLSKYDAKVAAYKKQNGSYEAVVREYEKQKKEHDLFEKIGQLKMQLGNAECEGFLVPDCSSDLAILETAFNVLNTCLADAGTTTGVTEIEGEGSVDYVEKILAKQTELENEYGFDPVKYASVGDDSFPMGCRDALAKGLKYNRKKALQDLEKRDKNILKQCYTYLTETLAPELKKLSDKNIENLKTKLKACVGTDSSSKCWWEGDILHFEKDGRLSSSDLLGLTTPDYLGDLIDECCSEDDTKKNGGDEIIEEENAPQNNSKGDKKFKWPWKRDQK